MVIVQILIIWTVVIGVYTRAMRRDGRAPIDDIGVLWLGIFALYATLPPVSWLLQGGEYSPWAGRLFQLQPETSEVVSLLNIALAYIFGFSLVYIVLLKRVDRPVAKAQAYIGSAKMAGAFVIVLAASLIGVLIGKMGIIRSAESYSDSYRVIAELPLGLRQLLKMLGNFSSVATLVLLVALLQRWPRYSWLFIFYMLSILVSISPEGSRTEVATGLFGIVIAWHVLIRPIPTVWLLPAGVFGLLAFLLFGILRNFGSLTSFGDQGLGNVGAGEFDTLWANAVELWQAKQSGVVYAPFAARFGEFFAFVPSQMLWFDKLDLSNWFLDNFHPIFKAYGGGLAFGAISQAVIGDGIVEAIIRGAILGTILSWIMKWVRMPTKVWWRFPLLLYILIWNYQLVRYSTFSLLGNVVQTVLPAFVAIAIIGSLLKSTDVRKHLNSEA